MDYVICRTQIDEVVGTIFYKKENDLKPTGKVFFWCNQNTFVYVKKIIFYLKTMLQIVCSSYITLNNLFEK